MLEYPAPVIIVDDFVGKAAAEQLFQYAIAQRIGLPAIESCPRGHRASSMGLAVSRK